jgi:hypothetical protein
MAMNSQQARQLKIYLAIGVANAIISILLYIAIFLFMPTYTPWSYAVMALNWLINTAVIVFFFARLYTNLRQNGTVNNVR